MKSHHQLDKEIDDQLYYLKDRLMIQLNDIVKKHFNTSTVTNDFKTSLQTSTKQYIDDINQKLSLESSLITERLKNFYNKTFDELLTPTIVELNEASILISKFKHDFENKVSVHAISIHLNDLADKTVRTISKKDLLKTSKAKEIQKGILNDTMELIDSPIVTFDDEIKQNLNGYDEQAEQYIEEYNIETNKLIDSYLSININNDLIERIEKILKEI